MRIYKRGDPLLIPPLKGKELARFLDKVRIDMKWRDWAALFLIPALAIPSMVLLYAAGYYRWLLVMAVVLSLNGTLFYYLMIQYRVRWRTTASAVGRFVLKSRRLGAGAKKWGEGDARRILRSGRSWR